MKQIANYNAKKYEDSKYTQVEEEIYKTEMYGDVYYVSSLSFVQEPEWKEGMNAKCISQYPLEDILDKFCCHVSDFYEELNTEESQICYLEFAGMDLEDIKELRSIIGKHVYNKPNGQYVKLVIE